jgi:hypothetical protein
LAEALLRKHQSQEADAVEDVRLQARSRLLAGLANGDLQAALRATKNERERDELEETRMMAQRTFLNAAANQNLPSALNALREERNNDELESLRVEARSKILNAALNGRLADALKESQQELRMGEELRMEACCADELCQMMPEKHENEAEYQQVEALRLQAKRSLLKSLRDGALQKKLAELGMKKADDNKMEISPLDAMRLQMRDLVIQASADGVMEDLYPEVETSAEETPVAEDSSDEALVDEELAKDEALFDEELAKLIEEPPPLPSAACEPEVACKEPVMTPSRQHFPSKSRRRIMEAPSRGFAERQAMSTSTSITIPSSWTASAAAATPMPSGSAGYLACRGKNRVDTFASGSAMMMDLGAGAAFRPPKTSSAPRLAALGKGLVSENRWSPSMVGVRVVKANPHLQPLTSSKSTSDILMPANHAGSTIAAGSIAWSHRMSRKSYSVGRLGAVF